MDAIREDPTMAARIAKLGDASTKSAFITRRGIITDMAVQDYEELQVK
jgi:hypothetical protein